MACGAGHCGDGDEKVKFQFWPFDRSNPTRENYIEIATLVVGYRSLGLARYRDCKATIADAGAAAFAASNHDAALDELERVITVAERDAEVFYWDGSERAA